MGGEVLQKARDGLGYRLEGPGLVGVHSRRSESGQRTSWRSGSGQGTLPEVGTDRETPLEVRDGSADPPRGPGWVA